jgi:TolB-like protein
MAKHRGRDRIGKLKRIETLIFTSKRILSMQKKLLLFICAVLLLYGYVFSENDVRISIAVNDLKGSGVDQATATIVSDRLRGELVNTGVFRVMERSEMETVLKEQGFQQSGSCNETSCLVQVGQLLGVQRMVAGSIGKVDNFWTISLRMLNVATGEILFTISEDYQGEVKDVISQVIAKAAAKLASGVGQEVKKAAMIGKKGDLYIESSQPVAAVEIDGVAVNDVTPLTLQGFAAGDHRIVVRKGDWFGSQNIFLNPDELLKVSIAMEQGKGSVEIFSKPSGASITIDGAKSGETPLKLNKLPAGEHALTISKDGYVGVTQSVRVTIGETQNLNIALKEAAWLSVKILPATATITIDGKPAGAQTMGNITVPAGEIEVQAEAADHDVFRQKILLSAGEKKTLDIRLTSIFGTLKVTSIPSGADIFLNEKRVGVTPYKNEKLLQDNYMLRLTLPAYQSITDSLSVVKEQTLDRHYKLVHTKVFLDSIGAAAKAAHKRSQLTRRIVFGAFAAGCAGVGAYFNQAAANAYSDYSRPNQTPNAYDTDWNKVQTNATTRNVLYSVAGVLAAAFVISIPF